MKKITLFILCLLSGYLVKAANPVASFSADQQTGCAPFTVSFTNHSVNATSYFWDFGNGNTSTLPNPQNVYSMTGTYTVKLLAIAPGGTEDSIISTNLITVVPNPTAGFTSSDKIVCINDGVVFQNNSINATSCVWDFGDGNTDSVQNPTHYYLTAGNYTIKLMAQNTFGCNNVSVKTNYITVNAKPVITFTVNTTAGCDTNQVFNFSSPVAGVNQWLWNFGDGSISTLENPMHTYRHAGNYTVSLITENTMGHKDTLTKTNYISVNNQPVPVFHASATTGCAPLKVNFTDSSVNAVVWKWNFGDGGVSSVKNPSYIYAAGNYNLSLTITTDNQCTYTTSYTNYIHADSNIVSADFSRSNPTGCLPVSVSFNNLSTYATGYLWNFGDGDTSTLKTPTHTYKSNGNYTVTLQSYNENGCQSLLQKSNAVQIVPAHAHFSADITPGCAPLAISFQNSSANSTQCLWNFGDGDTSTQTNPTHVYTTPGDFTVSLIAFNSLGCTDTMVLNAYVHVTNTIVHYTPPSTFTGCAPFVTTFSNTTPGATSWFWNFGDGSTSMEQNPSHIYTKAGADTVSLIVTLNGGCTQEYPVFRTFHTEGGVPEFTFNQPLCPPYIVNFTDTNASAFATWFWDFGDSSTSTLSNPTHTYVLPGFYTVTLKTTTADGCTNTLVQNNGIYLSGLGCNGNDTVNGEADNNVLTGSGTEGSFSGTGQPDTNEVTTFITGCAPVSVQFNNILNGTIAWFWDFGNGETSSLENPLHTYEMAGNYTVRMIGTDSAGIRDTVLYPNYIRLNTINTHFAVTQQSGSCQSATFLFTDSTQNAVTWLWNFGDGDTSTIPNPTYTYAGNIKNYSISLKTSNAEGCINTASSNILSSNDIPVLWSDASSACVNQAITFHCSSSDFSGYFWNFGDGSSDTVQNPTHIYATGGIFSVSLTTTDKGGCTYDFTLPNPLTVGNPVANFTDSLANGCNSLIVNFNNQSTGVLAPLSSTSLWNFGDGSSVLFAQNPMHSYANQGIYKVTLTVNYDSLCFNKIVQTINVLPTTVANFSYTANTTCFPITISCHDSSVNAVSWLWAFGDGDTSTLQNPAHVFTSAPSEGITLTITGINGCQASVTQNNLPVFKTAFTPSVTNGCGPLSVSYTDKSFHANQWLWNFGDGDTSTLENPTHIYLSSGTYTTTLISQNINGCIDTLAFNGLIVSKPKADFYCLDTMSCAPALIHFTDSSQDVTSWLWSFGDGTSSTKQNPSHIYNVPGIYTIRLIIGNAFRCMDTIVKINYVKVPGPTANFYSSTQAACNTSAIQFTDSSLNARVWNWNFGDGTTSAQQNPTHLYQLAGNYQVSLIVFDSIGCTSNYTEENPIEIYQVPKAIFTSSDTVFCPPYSVSFTNHSQWGTSYVWHFGNGDTSILSNSSYNYLQPGNYKVSLIASNPIGCTDTMQWDIVANPMPVVDFSTQLTAGCSPLAVSFTNLSASLPNAIYSWNFGNGSTSCQQNPTTTFINPGQYKVSLSISNHAGCYNTLVKPAFIEVYDTLPPAKSNIIVATVISNTSTEIVWMPSASNDFAYYRIYRKDNISDTFVLIDSIANSNTYSYTDNNLNTLNHSYCYKVQTVGFCGYALPLDSLQEHCTINITASGIDTNIYVTWTPYVGATVGAYKLYRINQDGSNEVLIATLSSAVLSYTDSGFACPNDYSYKARAYDLNGNNVSSYSDTSIASPAYNSLAHQQVNIVRSTVIDNTNVLTEWKAPSIAPEKVTGYNIYRSTDNVNFMPLTELPSQANDYLDNNVDVKNQNYYYLIQATNACTVPALQSNKSSSILLTTSTSDEVTRLQWTNYEGWANGVDHYVIQKLDDRGNWITVQTVDGNTLYYEEK